MQPTTKEYLVYLKNHPEPAIQSKYLSAMADSSPSMALMAPEMIRSKSTLLQQLLKDRSSDGTIPFDAYDKWFGAHWVLSILADLGYPAGDKSLKPMLNQCYSWLLSKNHASHIRTIDGRVRRCASQEGNCIYYSLALGIADDRTEELAQRLLQWQWVDGGWNCDKKPEAAICSFNETLIPLRGLTWFSRVSGDRQVQLAVERAAEVFLKRNLFKRMRDGKVIDPNFILLHYPNYWHYDYLFGLKVLAEAGYIGDTRCNEGLELLLSRQCKDGGFPAEARYYRVDEKKLSGHSRVDWGGTSKIKSNPYVSADAFGVLHKAGRLNLL